MSYKDILAIVLSSEEDDPALNAAEALAQRFAAHASAVYLTALPDEPLAYEPSVVAGVWAELLGRARTQAASDRAKVADRLKRAGSPFELRSSEALARDLGRVAAVHARYADLAVLTRPGGDDGRDARHDVVEGVLFHSGRPALIVPPKWSGASIGRRPVIAWDASREATRALNDSYPLIDGCEKAVVLTIDAKPKTFGHGDQPGANIGAHLSRRGMSVEVRNVDGLGRPAAEAMLAEAHALNADLIVMGGYVHARLREFMFGGATRDMLEASDLPLLMAH